MEGSEESRESRESRESKEMIASLRAENRALIKEVEFYQSLWKDHSMTVISMLFKKSKQGEPVWINLQEATLAELKSLDPDPDVERWIYEQEGIDEIVFEA